MPRRAKGAYLWLRPERRSKDNKRSHQAAWIIIDRGQQFATGCAADEIEKAEQKLAQYVAAKYEPSRKHKDIELIDIADVLSIFYDDSIERQANPLQFERRVERQTNTGAARC